MFTTLLEPDNPPMNYGSGACDDTQSFRGQESGWWGGTAVVTGAAGAAPSLHLAVIYNGVFPVGSRDQTVRFILALPEKNQTIIDEVFIRIK